jgi:hypothetical protein
MTSPLQPHRLARTAVALAALLLAGRATYAVDAVVLIDQAAANAGLGLGDAPGFPVTLVQSGSLPWLVASWIAAAHRLYPVALGCSFTFFLTGLRRAHNAHHYALGLPGPPPSGDVRPQPADARLDARRADQFTCGIAGTAWKRTTSRR